MPKVADIISHIVRGYLTTVGSGRGGSMGAIFGAPLTVTTDT